MLWTFFLHIIAKVYAESIVLKCGHKDCGLMIFAGSGLFVREIDIIVNMMYNI